MLNTLKFLRENKEYMNSCLIKLAENLHHFPNRWIPPLLIKDNFNLKILENYCQLEALTALRRFRWLSKKA